MANIDTDYLNVLLERFKNYKKPSDTRLLLIALGEKKQRSDDDNKKLAILLKAEKKLDELTKARGATQRLLNSEKTAERKLQTRKKVIWGSALKTASKEHPDIAQLMLRLFDSNYVSDRDKDAVKADYEAVKAIQTHREQQDV